MKAGLLRTLGATGTLLFATLFVFTFWRPVWIEAAGKDFIAAQVEHEVGGYLAAATNDDGGVLARAASELHRRNAGRIAELRAILRTDLAERIGTALAAVRDPTCACRARVAALLRAGAFGDIATLEAANLHFADVVQGRYLRVVGELTRDLRIFTGINAVACLLLLIASFARPRAIDHLVFPGVLLAIAVIVSSYCYVFAQNWLLAILYSDYFGFAYLGLLTFIFGLLLDIFLNRGRVTTRAGNALLHAVGSSFTLTLC